MSNFIKKINYLLEIQNGDKTFWVLLTPVEANKVRTDLSQQPDFSIPIGLRNLAGRLINCSQHFVDRPIAPEIKVQMKFLNGDGDNEYSPELKPALDKWMQDCGVDSVRSLYGKIAKGIGKI